MATTLAKISIKDSRSWNSFLDLIYPIGSLYFSSNSTSLATRFGGTWSTLADGRYLRLNTWGTGGNNTMTVDQMPNHYHTVKYHVIVDNGWQENNHQWALLGQSFDATTPFWNCNMQLGELLNPTGGGNPSTHNTVQFIVGIAQPSIKGGGLEWLPR